MRAYLDTSVVVAALVAESASDRVLVWFEACEADEMAISDWVRTEVSSALSIKVRTGKLSPDGRAAASARFQRLIDTSLTVLPVARRHFMTAGAYADRHDLGLRSGDALHLALSVDRGSTLFSLDRRLVEAGPHLGALTSAI